MPVGRRGEQPLIDHLLISLILPAERTGKRMSNTSLLIVDMSVLVGIFLLGLLAKLFPRNGGKAASKQ